MFEKLSYDYKRSLLEYVATSDEAFLEEAYELGRRAMRVRIGFLEMKAIHKGILIDLLNKSASVSDVIEKIDLCEQFFEECLAPLEIAERGFQEDKEELQLVNKSLEEQVVNQNLDLELSVAKLKRIIDQVVETIVFMGETRDAYTSGHERRVSDLALAIGVELGLADETLEAIRLAGMLHDVGKIAIPLEILIKPGRLSDEEMSIIRTHSAVGHDILSRIEFPYPIAAIVLQNHERLDGSGYPFGLKSKDIMVEAKILAVADTVEAMSSHRPYRPAYQIERAFEEIKKNAGTLYDKEIVDICISLFDKGLFRFQDEDKVA